MEQISRERLSRFRRVTVMGLGLFGGGAGAARYFAGLGATVTVTDMSSREKLAPSIAALDGLGITFVFGEHRREDFANADLVVANQAVRPENPYLAVAREAGALVVTETGLALALNRSPWLGVTGSSGKSTTAALAAAMLTAHDPRTLFGGNIGGDLLTRVEGRPEDAPLAVELSSFQLTYISRDFANHLVRPPKVAVITNITPNHLDWHKDFTEYAEAKCSLIAHQTPADWAILNTDDPTLDEWATAARGRVVQCVLNDAGRPDSCHVEGDAVALRLAGREALRLPLARFRLRGRHNVRNALQAVAAAYAMTSDAAAATSGFESFGGLPHRLETVGVADGRTFVNDSKATTPEAACLALDAIAEPKIVIAGGYDKKSPFDRFGEAIQEKAAGLVLVGAAAGRIREAVRNAAGRRPEELGPLPVAECGDDFNQAVGAAYRMCPPGGVVLLSPGCASYGMFVNYEERGAVFGELAKRLANS